YTKFNADVLAAFSITGAPPIDVAEQNGVFTVSITEEGLQAAIQDAISANGVPPISATIEDGVFTVSIDENVLREKIEDAIDVNPSSPITASLNGGVINIGLDEDALQGMVDDAVEEAIDFDTTSVTYVKGVAMGFGSAPTGAVEAGAIHVITGISCGANGQITISEGDLKLFVTLDTLNNILVKKAAAAEN
ncbi:MAG: hypothetical protein HUK22_06890, partial [Thermoguttaceae bacterium]|nr:hypothetical protein [Thermoguttaceae bacterium]